MNILFAAAEAYPLVKEGGLGDVIGSLPQALQRAGHDVRIILPRYSTINPDGQKPVSIGSFSLPFMGAREEITIDRVSLGKETPVYLVGSKAYFNRPAVYGEPDDLQRFLLFSLALMKVAGMVGWRPDILHCHDWHTGMALPLLKVDYRDDPVYSRCTSVFTVHNLAYRGWFDHDFLEAAGLHRYMPPDGNPLRDKCYSMTGLAIYHSDVMTTVSESYAREILTPEYGEGLETLLQSRKDRLFGIVNGLDYEQFDPGTDRVLAVNYDVNAVEKRAENKIALQRQAGLPVNPDVPLIGMAGRLVEQKGIDITEQALNSLLGESDVQFVLQGAGSPVYQELMQNFENRHQDKARMFLEYDLALAHRIFAGCDIFLVPSRFEPCGLTPLIAMRYGAIPVVRRTGGLGETINDYVSNEQNGGIGFIFDKYDAGELLNAVKRALDVFADKQEWHRLVVRAMNADYSWNASLPKYLALYESARSMTIHP